MNIERFKEELDKLGINYDEDKIIKLNYYYDLLISWNEKINLTAITDKDLVFLKHFYDSLTIVKIIDLNTVASLCDIGTGAGFPGIVLKIFYPHIKLTLIDSLGKRIKFLNEVVSKLNLDDVSVLHVRAEDYSREVREKYDVVTARAVSSFNVLLEYCIPLVKIQKYFVAMRGNDDTLESSRALNVLGANILDVKTFNLPIENSIRTLALVQKNKKTDNKYPRRYSEIKKRPL